MPERVETGLVDEPFPAASDMRAPLYTCGTLRRKKAPPGGSVSPFYLDALRRAAVNFPNSGKQLSEAGTRVKLEHGVKRVKYLDAEWLSNE